MFGTLAEAIAATAEIDNRAIAELQDTIDRLAEELELQDDRVDQAHSTGYDNGYRMGRESIRQARLVELLEAEAGERVDEVPSSVWSPSLSAYDTGLRFVCDDASVSLSSCGVLRLEGARLDCSEASNLILCLAAALAEKRKREGEVSDGV